MSSQLHAALFSGEKDPGTICIEVKVDPKSGLDAVKKSLAPVANRTLTFDPDPVARSYRLS
jgi:hypothetical protein